MPPDPTSAVPHSSPLHRPIPGKTALSHAIYGLILMVAELGELFEHHVEAGDAALLLLGGGLGLLLIHAYAGSLGTLAGSSTPMSGRFIANQVRDEAPVAVGFGAAIVVLLTTTALGVELDAAYRITVTASLLFLGVLGGLAVVRRPTPARRLLGGLMTAGVGGLVIAIEQAIG